MKVDYLIDVNKGAFCVVRDANFEEVYVYPLDLVHEYMAAHDASYKHVAQFLAEMAGVAELKK